MVPRFLTAAASVAIAVTCSVGAKAETQQCAAQAAEYRQAIGEVSRFRAANQELAGMVEADLLQLFSEQEGNALSRAQLALEALRAGQCRIPAVAPSALPYLAEARICGVEIIRSRHGRGDLQRCNARRWNGNPEPIR